MCGNAEADLVKNTEYFVSTQSYPKLIFTPVKISFHTGTLKMFWLK